MESRIFELDSRAKDRIREFMNHKRYLCQQLVKKIQGDIGRITAYLPADFDQEKLYQFDRWVPLPPSIREYTFELIIQEMKRENCLLIADSWTYRKGDRWMVKDNTRPLLFYGLEVYEYCNEGTRDKISRFFSNASGGAGVVFGMVYKIRPYPDIKLVNRMELSREQLDQFAENTTSIIMDAYDGDGYLMWEL